jgi:hypothetical protein
MHQFSTAGSYHRAFPTSTTATPQRPQRYYAKLLDHSKNNCERVLSPISPNPRVGTLGGADRKIDLCRTKKKKLLVKESTQETKTEKETSSSRVEGDENRQQTFQKTLRVPAPPLKK